MKIGFIRRYNLDSTSLSNGVDCAVKMHADALAYIQQLEAANAELLTKVEQLEVENKLFMETIGLLHVTENQLETKCHQLEQERDAAVNELIGTCQVCRWEETEKCASCHFNSDAWNVCESNWEWRGVKEE